MTSKAQKSKIERKQRRCQQIIRADTGIDMSCEATPFIAVCNAGLSMGLEAEQLLQEASKFGDVEELVMIPNKSYCFIKGKDIQSSKSIYDGLHGKTNLAQNAGCLYLSYFKDIPASDNPMKDQLPEGLILIEDFITEEEEATLLKIINDGSSGSVDNSLKHRVVKHYGYEFLYECNNVDINQPLSSKIPAELGFLWSRLRIHVPSLHSWEPDQLTVNIYSPGQGIPSHVDTHSAFTDPIISLSLESSIVMEFKKKTRKVPVFLPQRSILVMSGESRYDWMHGIVPRVYDIVPKPDGGLTVRRRAQRTSLTFRQLRREDCHCNFTDLCDTFKKNIKSIIEENVASKLEYENVHKVYDEIANHFSDTRHKPWPKVQEFVDSFPGGAVLLDVGCGNGKYLENKNNILKIGCDRSEGLLKVCTERKCNVFKCDCLALPIRSDSIDGCISIAVIHHLATEDRRLNAISEMLRILRKDGRGLIYVWAKNQEVNNKKSNYLKQGKAKENPLCSNVGEENFKPKLGLASNVNLPIHTNRTQFEQQDVFVPWKLKSENEEKCVFLRYYHVFEENELENLCKRLENVRIENSYYDQGNWCIIFRKV